MAKQKLVEVLAATVVEEAKKQAPVVTGELQRSISILSMNDNEAIVGHTATANILITHNYERIIYPIFVHEGTAPYIIEPNKKKLWRGVKAATFLSAKE
jgi:hypothetical protein